MNIKYEYEHGGKIFKCPFKAKCWDFAGNEKISGVVFAIIPESNYPFQFLTDNDHGASQYCTPITTTIKPWTAETAPFPLALRQKNWVKGMYCLFNPCKNFASSCSADEDGSLEYVIRWEELAAPDSEWETRDGQPCGEVCDQ